MYHELQLKTRAEAGTGTPALVTGGCLTTASYPALLRALKAAARAANAPVIVDLRSARHLDPDVLLDLRALAHAPSGPSGAAADRSGQNAPVLSLVEPAALPVCLAHVGIDGEVLTRLDTGPLAHPAGSTLRHGNDGPGGENPAAGPTISEYLDGTLDPASTVRALSTEALEQLIDALFRHLDSPAPSFAARTWFALATEEHHCRR